MNRLRATFSRLRVSNQPALIPFIMGGDPGVSATASLLLSLEDAGADVIEIGIPFSDPLADGPVIQQASARALARGATPKQIFQAVASVRSRIHVPIVCLTYWNPVIQFAQGKGDASSVTRFVQSAHASGFSGVIVPDVPVEEGALLRSAAGREEFAAIFLAAPTSPAARLRAIVQASTGFIYYVSVTGTTGVRRRLPVELLTGIRQLKLLTAKPVCVGFGISTAEQARYVAKVADGVIVGSALVKTIAQAKRSEQAIKAKRFVSQLKRAIKGG